MQFLNYFLDIVFPKLCLSCGIEGFLVCPDCVAKIPIQTDFHCFICKKRSPGGKICPQCRKKAGQIGLTGLLIASDWRNLLVRQLIYECKYRFIKALADPMADVMIQFLETNILTNPTLSGAEGWQIDKLILVPVPLHKKRTAWRGFNQAEEIASAIAKKIQIPIYKNLIERMKNTAPQMEIKDKKERTRNVAGAFRIDKNFREDIRGKVIILIDDVCTTAATLNECAAAIKGLGPNEIWGLALARG